MGYALPNGLRASGGIADFAAPNREGIGSRIRRLSYLGSPDRIRAAIINETGDSPSVSIIQRHLDRHVDAVRRLEEELKSDERDFVVGSLLSPVEREDAQIAARQRFINEAKPKIESIAALIPDRREPEPVRPPITRPVEIRARRKARPTRYTVTNFAHALSCDVAAYFGYTLTELRSASRRKCYVRVRAIVVVLLREKDALKYSYPRIAAILGRKDHSTAIHAFDQFEVYCKANPDIYEAYKHFGGRRELAVCHAD